MLLEGIIKKDKIEVAPYRSSAFAISTLIITMDIKRELTARKNSLLVGSHEAAMRHIIIKPVNIPPRDTFFWIDMERFLNIILNPPLTL